MRNEIVEITKECFVNPQMLNEKVSKCDVIIHLAALNRHADHSILQATNISLVETLIRACEITGTKPHVVFTSSWQEDLDNPYGNSKKAGRELFEEWSVNTGALFTSLSIPNVFGPFGKPFYNSVVATFCHQLSLNETPQIIDDRKLPLIYINSLIQRIWTVILKKEAGNIKIEPQYNLYVSEILQKLTGFKNDYVNKNEFPSLNDQLSVDLFNTFRCYLPVHHYPVKFKKNEDHRGMFVELLRNHSGGQFSYSTTLPGVTRGNHFHTRKMERFAVIKGAAEIKIRRVDTNNIITYRLSGQEPSFVDMPVWHTHHITNIGKEELITIFWINEPYDPQDPDTFFIEV